MDVVSLLNEGRTLLEERGVPNARKNAEWILSHVMQCRLGDLYIGTVRRVDEDRADTYMQLIRRRGSREPLQYILGSTEFMSLAFELNSRVFIPRCETEILVERVEAVIGPLSAADLVTVLDLGCGPGVIAISLGKRLSNVTAVGVDASRDAVDLAGKNARLNGVADRVSFLMEDAGAYLERCGCRYDIVVSNPPYIRSGDIERLPPEVREFEPLLALDGGEDGLDFYRRVAPLLPPCLTERGLIAFEIGSNQAHAVRDILLEAGFENVRVFQDYNKLDRVVLGRTGRT